MAINMTTSTLSRPSPTVAPGEPTNGAFTSEPDSQNNAIIVTSVAVGGVIFTIAVFAICWYLYMGSWRSPPLSRASGSSAARVRTHPGSPQQGAGVTRSSSTNWARHDYRNNDAVELEGGIELQPWRARESPRTTSSAMNAEPQQQQRDTPVAVRNLERSLQAYPSRYMNCSSVPTMSSPSTMPGPVTPATTSNASRTQYAIATPQRPERVYTTPSVYRPQPAKNPFTISRQPSLPTIADGPENPFTTTTSTEQQQQPANPFTDAQHASRSAVSIGSNASLYGHIDSSMDLYHALTTNNGDAAGTVPGATAPKQQQQQEIVYRGLSTRSGEPAPWDFLSAEDAVGGGWRNSVGWETVGEE